MNLPSRRQFLLSLAAGTAGLSGMGIRSRIGGTPRHDPDSEDSRCVDALAIERSDATAFGTKVSITAMHADRQRARLAVTAGLAEIEIVDRLMSLYRPDSQVSEVNRCGRLASPHAYMIAILQQSQRISQATEGAFDVTVQPLWPLYRNASRAGGHPQAEEVRNALAVVDWRRVQVSSREIRLAGPGTAITLNGIAQGFAGDRAMDALRRHGIRHALIDSGEIGALGGKQDDRPWTVGIQHPREKDAYAEFAGLDNRCLATSGDYATAFGDDFRDHHIFDPHTGCSPQRFASVSIAAPTAAEADALATAVFVLGLDKGLELIRSLRAVDAFFILKDGRTLKTDGFPLARAERSDA